MGGAEFTHRAQDARGPLARCIRVGWVALKLMWTPSTHDLLGFLVQHCEHGNVGDPLTIAGDQQWRRDVEMYLVKQSTNKRELQVLLGKLHLLQNVCARTAYLYLGCWTYWEMPEANWTKPDEKLAIEGVCGNEYFYADFPQQMHEEAKIISTLEWGCTKPISSIPLFSYFVQCRKTHVNY